MFHNLAQAIKTNRWLSIFILFIIINYIFLAFCSVIFPQNITDNLYNHLSRIGYWIQQGSLKHYSGFSIFGMIYPYNNSLLISLPIVFLKTDNFSGFVQFFAAIISALSIFSISTGIGFSKKSSLISALIGLTYPIILYESITAQSDLLLAAFVSASFALLVSYIKTGQKIALVFSLLGMALAVGTNQFALIVLPGYCVLLIYGLVKTKSFSIKSLRSSLLVFLTFTLLLGSYSYIQNLINFGSPFGPKEFLENVTNISKTSEISDRIKINSSRLFGQFISCDGLPPQISKYCLKARATLLTPLLSKEITSEKFLYSGVTYDLLTPNIYNAEYAWYGPISWLLILPSIVYGLINSIKNKKYINLILLMVPIAYFFFLQLTKFGWDPYQGRYLITAIVLIQPLTAWIFEPKTPYRRIMTGLICLLTVFIMVYSTLNNVSLPLTSKKMCVQVERWGKVHSVLIQKIAYKVKPFVMADKDVWPMNRMVIMTMGNNQLLAPAQLVESLVPEDRNLGIYSETELFPDYIFRGKQVTRNLSRIIDSQDLDGSMDYILLAPEYQELMITGYTEIERVNGWVLLSLSEN